ncbi:folate-binding protein [Corynebacterium sp. MSK008]|uniref:CAF17-like 4Fe-4S cluster assembly/insertion protein YgfZ n=1 Tax=Corynebacterium sp. MSK008 TaxID=3050188 RepID=UPI00254B1B58|nr:folate-binding protein [Corynebacterium sp. MSK008]MDK8879045.1 folate-binding protein [Corynebacterium sp. MSK008]
MGYASELLTRPGAQELPGDSLLDAKGVPWHYGNPLTEQRITEPTLVDRSHRAVIAVSGPDAPTFLNNLLSQKLDDVADGFAASALDLDAQGRILHHADVAVADGVYYFDLPSYQRETFVDFLRKMVFWSEVTIEEPDLGVLTILGPVAQPDFGQVFTRRLDGWGGIGRTDIAVPKSRITEVADQFPLAGLMAFTAYRVAAGEPEARADLDEKSIPHEAPNLINRGEKIRAVHLEKGCYRGQETVARVENLGRSPRLLVKLQLDGSAPNEPEIGAEITAGGRKVGRVGTVVHDADEGPVALALVKRSALQAPLDIGGTAASVDQSSLPADEGEHAGRRAVDRLRRGPESQL